MTSIRELLGNVDSFLEEVMTSLHGDRIDVSLYKLDHICYRVDSIQKYEKNKHELSKLGKLLAESYINERKISVFKLEEPIKFKERKIDVIELPAPKADNVYKDGLEHVEFAIPMKLDVFRKKHSDIVFDKSKMLKENNPYLTIKYYGFSVRFHNRSLEYILDPGKKVKNIKL